MEASRPVLSGAGLSLRRWVYRRLAKSRRTRWLVRDRMEPFRVAVDGLTYDLRPSDNTSEHEMFLTGHLPEPASMALLLDRVQGKRALVFDIGANCGAYAVPLARAVAPGSRVLAFEPNPAMADRLERNLALNGLAAMVTLHRVALGASAGTLDLNLHHRNLGQSSLRPLKGARTVSVPIRPLTGFLDRPDGCEVFVVKIDVEGYEDAVLVPFLDSVADADLPDLILIEIVQDNLWSADLRGALQRRGYRGGAEIEGNVPYERQAA
jgi:FkbM family methyltransferase